MYFDQALPTEYDQREFGSGNPRLLVIGGMTSTLGDFTDLQNELGGTFLYNGDPWYEGAFDAAPLDEHDSEHSQSLADFVCEQEIDALLTHSRGAVIALMMQKLLGRQTKPIIMIAPPLQIPNLKTLLENAKQSTGPVDAMLRSSVGQLPEHRYAQMLEEHTQTYGPQIAGVRNHMKELLKRAQDPNYQPIKTGLKESKVPVKIISSAGDIYTNALAEHALGQMPNVSIERLATTGHFPHMENPKVVAQNIKKEAWWKW